MILVDDREERKDRQSFVATISELGVKAAASHLEFADFAFTGNGPSGEVLIGIERKTVRNMLADIRTEHFSGHQLVGLKNTYSRIYLVLEGVWRRGMRSGVIESPQGGKWLPLRLGNSSPFSYKTLDMFLLSMEEAGIRVEKTYDHWNTAVQVVEIYTWWQKPYADHKAAQAFYSDPDCFDTGRKHSLLRRWAKELGKVKGGAGIGWEKSKYVEARFPSAYALATAELKDLYIPRVIGKTLARRIYDEIRKEKGRKERHKW